MLVLLLFQDQKGVCEKVEARSIWFDDEFELTSSLAVAPGIDPGSFGQGSCSLVWTLG